MKAPLILIIVALAIIVAAIIDGSKKQQECEGRGGVMMKTMSGKYQCLKVEVIK